ncbi:hypothetical protein L198_02820 [Cryptococcus wingfieldii CBS 7118]|uniref:BZIP domain-containing protein n=1 Tax=Cryptococcus wingfieldii CBS 7118 TaxID=1295528 RepID=A0A1E3JMI7_9TREE|nr:hypothetical protein L198_02820 [Cryptococcus wingfieldii CBS 7118]ODO02089.1 hypothetical protein L198_02820 [Cryptococcus wingfieldii CBS 7118]
MSPSIDYHDILRQADDAFPSLDAHVHDTAQLAHVVDQHEQQHAHLSQHHEDVGELGANGAEYGMDIDQHPLDAGQHEQRQLEQAQAAVQQQTEQRQPSPVRQPSQHELPVQPQAGTSTQKSKGLTAEEKKERQRLQNRRAAEKSRNKKKNEQMALEQNVAGMQEENQRLRARLQSLIAARPSDASVEPTHVDQLASPVPAPPATVIGTGIDYVYLSKLHNELANSKGSLLEKSADLSRMTAGDDGPLNDEHRPLRLELIANLTKLAALRSEMAGLENVMTHVVQEKQNMQVERAKVERELAGRRVARERSAVAQQAVQDDPNIDPSLHQADPEGAAVAHEATGVQDEQADEGDDGQPAEGGDRALLDIRGWIDAAVKDWHQDDPDQDGSGDKE